MQIVNSSKILSILLWFYQFFYNFIYYFLQFYQFFYNFINSFRILSTLLQFYLLFVQFYLFFYTFINSSTILSTYNYICSFLSFLSHIPILWAKHSKKLTTGNIQHPFNDGVLQNPLRDTVEPLHSDLAGVKNLLISKLSKIMNDWLSPNGGKTCPSALIIQMAYTGDELWSKFSTIDFHESDI